MPLTPFLQCCNAWRRVVCSTREAGSSTRGYGRNGVGSSARSQSRVSGGTGWRARQAAVEAESTVDVSNEANMLTRFCQAAVEAESTAWT